MRVAGKLIWIFRNPSPSPWSSAPFPHVNESIKYYEKFLIKQNGGNFEILKNSLFSRQLKNEVQKA